MDVMGRVFGWKALEPSKAINSPRRLFDAQNLA